MSTGNSDAAIVRRLIDSESGEWSADEAKVILKLRFSSYDNERMHQLLEKAQAGTLSSDEDREIDRYRHLGNLITVLWASARRAIRNADQRAVSSTDNSEGA
jgi:hypothetical protein